MTADKYAYMYLSAWFVWDSEGMVIILRVVDVAAPKNLPLAIEISWK